MTDTTNHQAERAAAERVFQGVLRRAGDIDDYEQGLMRDAWDACTAYHAAPRDRQKDGDSSAGNGDGMALTNAAPAEGAVTDERMNLARTVYAIEASRTEPRPERREWFDAGYKAGIADVAPTPTLAHEAVTLTDEQILAIGRQHFRPGHDPKAEPAFVAAVRSILAASAQRANETRDVKRLDFMIEDGAIIDTIINGEGEKRYHLYWPGLDESQRAWYCTPRAAIDAQMAAITHAPDTEIEALLEGRAENSAAISADSAVNSGETGQ